MKTTQFLLLSALLMLLVWEVLSSDSDSSDGSNDDGSEDNAEDSSDSEAVALPRKRRGRPCGFRPESTGLFSRRNSVGVDVGVIDAMPRFT